VTAEPLAGTDIKTAAELTVSLPEDHMTMFELGRRRARETLRTPVPEAGPARKAWAYVRRVVLRRVVRFEPVAVEAAYVMTNSNSRGLETAGWRYDFDNRLSASAEVLRALKSPDDAPTTIVLDDRGRAEASDAVSARVNRGDLVVALDLLFTSSADSIPHPYPVHDRMLACIGHRSLGLRAAKLNALTDWLAA
jgi:hypothetical protein